MITVLFDLPVELDAFFEQRASRSSCASIMKYGAQPGQRGSLASLVPQGAIELWFFSIHNPCLELLPCSSHFPHFTRLSGCHRLDRNGGKQQCCEQANACDDDQRNERPAIGLIFRDD
jgi:hypothetical protein